MMTEWRSVLVILGLVSLCFFGIPIRVDKPHDVELFDNFIAKYNKTYLENKTEYNTRYKIFQESLKRIKQLNNNQSALFGITKFSDLTPAEFHTKILQPDLPNHIRKRKLHKKHKIHERHNNSVESNELSKAEFKHPKSIKNIAKRAVLPQIIDWREKNVVTPVRDQGSCGACWAHSTIATMESMAAITTGNLVPLSVQEMVDCSINNLGCGGGDTCSLLTWLFYDHVAVLSEDEYPVNTIFEGPLGYCHLNETSNAKYGVYVDTFTCENLSKNEKQMLTYLATHGPLTVAVNALTWQYYLGGIIQYHCDGQPGLLNHAVQIVGYNLSSEVPFYIVRNSWGKTFGDGGYLYIAIGNNLCGIGNEVSTINVSVMN